MKKVLFTFGVALILCFNTDFYAQSDSSVSVVNKTAAALKMSEAEELLNEGQVREAMSKYRDAIEKNPFSSKAHAGLATCQYKILNYGFAESAAEKAFALDKKNPEAALILAMCKHRLNKLNEAQKFYMAAAELYKERSAIDLDIPLYLKHVDLAKKMLEQGQKIERKAMVGANSDFMDYGPILFDGGKRLFFASRRSGTTGGMKNPSDQVYFEDVYEAVWNEKLQEWDSVTNKIGKLNSRGFDAVSHVSTNGEELYMTINNTMDPKTKRKNRTGSSDIALAKKRADGNWAAPKVISGTVNTDFFEGSATLTADGKTMYYVTQTAKSINESTDIYVSRLQGKIWSKGEKLSDNINNNGRQTTPFISADGNYLFFSSNGHDGIGGFDVYVAKRNGVTWSKPLLLGLGINSVNDDTHFKYYPELKRAVLASIVVDENKATYNMFTVDMSNFDIENLKFEW